MTPSQKDGPRSNQDIRVPCVQLINDEGQNQGIIATQEALAMAADVGLDLVEIVPNAEPPVCKIIDLGKLKYQNQKKQLRRVKNKRLSKSKKSRCDQMLTFMIMR